jgi:hypothetical protein
LFASGDFTIWAQALVTEVGPGGDYTRSPPRNVINSSSSATAYTSDWINITADNYGPKIQLNQSSTVETDYNWLYLANSEQQSLESFQRRGGNMVFINSDNLTCTDEWTPV